NELAGADASSEAEMRRAYAAADESHVSIDWPGLALQLAEVHPVHYAQIASKLSASLVRGVRRIDDQAVALRLVHFVDKLYDQEVCLMLSTVDDVPLAEIFSAAYRHGGNEKKYRRCLSRLHELISETRALRGRQADI